MTDRECLQEATEQLSIPENQKVLAIINKIEDDMSSTSLLMDIEATCFGKTRNDDFYVRWLVSQLNSIKKHAESLIAATEKSQRLFNKKV